MSPNNYSARSRRLLDLQRSMGCQLIVQPDHVSRWVLRKPDGTYVGTLGEWPATHRPGLVLELRVEPQHQTQGTER